MRIQLNLSFECRKAALVERGEEMPDQVMVDVPLAELSSSARAILAEMPWGSDRDGQYIWTGKHTDRLAIPQTPAEWEGMLLTWDGKRREQAEQAALDKESRAREERERREAYAPQKALLDEAQAERLERDAAKKAASEQERAEWIAAHGSDHLRAAVAAGYDCKRRYVIERAALEHPGYTVDFDDVAEWRDRSCPSEDALAEELHVTPALGEGEAAKVVWLTSPPRAEAPSDDDYHDAANWEPCEAAVIRGFLGHYDLVRSAFPPAADPADYEELPAGYQRLGRTLRHPDAVMLLDGYTDCRELSAQHRLISGPLPEGVWFSRTFVSVDAARQFAVRRAAVSSRRTRQA